MSELALPKTRVASPTISLEEITPRPNRTHNGDKGKSKANASVWDDVATALGKAYNVIMVDKLKGLSAVPFHKLVNRHIHKLIHVFFIYVCFIHSL